MKNNWLQLSKWITLKEEKNDKT